MIDGHIHIERGEYTLEWINKFVDTAAKNGIDENMASGTLLSL